ncbi:MAG: phosphoribosylformylglycinamidine cyclo-ligase [Gemmatimonadales bacterium]|nr:MAG: phosphoribosylformylglycinamidine cyclo-ligase [Gemmatimonadales bacterium]
MLDPQDSLSYAAAGVNLHAAEDLTMRLKRVVESTRTSAARSEFGTFGGHFRLTEPTDLVASADGVGTKVLVAAASGIHDTVGEDLVNHCVNDILAEGAEPLFFLDYFACGKLDADVAEAVIGGVARGCRNNGCALIGGESAEMPGVYEAGTYDLAGFIVGRKNWHLPGKNAVRPGSRLIGFPSNGLHTNGYSLARRVLFDRMGLQTTDPFPGSDRSVAEVLLKVHRSYLHALRPALDRGSITAIAHITGGGIPGNLNRVLPADMTAHVDVTSWTPLPEFQEIARGSGLEPLELFSAFNMGVGLIVVAEPDRVPDVLESTVGAGITPFECGEIQSGDGSVRLVGI